MYEPRTYRSIRNNERFTYTEINYLETDLLIGIDKGSDVKIDTLKIETESFIKTLRKEIDTFIGSHPEFMSSLVPLNYPDETIPKPVKRLLKAGKLAQTGPMAGIAGLFAEETGRFLTGNYDVNEIVVENGGDVFTIINSALKIIIHAGSSPLSERMIIELQPGEWGICSSSGTIGHSLSLGKADALTVLALDTVLADCMATSLANKVISENDINPVLELAADFRGLEGVLIIKDEKAGVVGNIKLC